MDVWSHKLGRIRIERIGRTNKLEQASSEVQENSLTSYGNGIRRAQ